MVEEIQAKYSIVGLRQEADSVLLTLREYRPPPSPEEIERARLEAELEEEPEPIETEGQLKKVDFKPLPKSEEEAFTRRIIKAWRDEMPRMFEELDRPPPSFNRARGNSVPQMMVVRTPLELWVSNEHYRELGCPSIFQVITLTLKMGA